EPIRLGVGVNSGRAQVGNVGSHIKFKYGPRGTVVNLASRVEGANKFWKTSILITEQTRAGIDDSVVTRRLRKGGVVNIAEPVTLHEVAPPGSPQWPNLKQGYESALAHFEKKEFRQAARILGNLLPDYPDDGPAYVLLARAVQGLLEEPEKFDAVW